MSHSTTTQTTDCASPPDGGAVRWLAAEPGWVAVHAYALSSLHRPGERRYHSLRTYDVAGWEITTDQYGPRCGVPVVARGGQLAALDTEGDPDHLVVLGRLRGGRAERAEQLADLQRRAGYGMDNRLAAEAVAR
ncbi:MAG: hypothetical protein M3291_12240 [Actinomycetota bacterium]|nr:hypothetical protein [Actinomycetota bacterium]